MAAKFDWSRINRHELNDYIWSLHPKVVNKEMTISNFHRVLGNHLRKHVPIKLKKWGDSDVENNCVWIGGTYYSDLDK